MTVTTNTTERATLHVDLIEIDAGTQFRTKDDIDQDHIKDMRDLITKGVTWKQPMQVAEFEGRYILTDGFHRHAAYLALNTLEIPAHQYVIVPCATEADYKLLALKANESHGRGTTDADRMMKVRKLIEMDADKYLKKGKCSVDTKAVQAALEVALSKVYRAIEPINAELKGAADARLVEMFNEGRTRNEIIEETGLGKTTVHDRCKELKDEATAKSGILTVEKNGQLEDAPSVAPPDEFDEFDEYAQGDEEDEDEGEQEQPKQDAQKKPNKPVRPEKQLTGKQLAAAINAAWQEAQVNGLEADLEAALSALGLALSTK